MPQPKGARSTSCGVMVAFVCGIALIATSMQATSGESTQRMDGAHVLRQARWTPSAKGGAPVPAEPQSSIPPREIPAAATASVPPKAVPAVPANGDGLLKPEVGGKGACLITKWSAVWIVHPDGKTRSHVSTPTAACDLHASNVEDIDKYTKSHGGAGEYSLSEEQSKLACEKPGCFASSTSKAPGAGGDALQPPTNGWGNGVSDGWLGRSNLRVNPTAESGFVSSPPPAGEPLILVFGGASVTDMLRNWAIHAKELGMGYTVACMDDGLFQTATSQLIPAAIMKDTSASNGAVTTRWKYYRMDPKAFMQMGILKVRVLLCLL